MKISSPLGVRKRPPRLDAAEGESGKGNGDTQAAAALTLPTPTPHAMLPAWTALPRNMLNKVYKTSETKRKENTLILVRKYKH